MLAFQSISACYIGELFNQDLKDLQLTLQNIFQKKILKPTRDCFYHLTSSSVYRVKIAGDTVPRLTRLKKHGT